MALHVLVLAGGSGTRLWPLSRRSVPKHLLPLGPDGTTLLRATVQRLLPLTPNLHVVTAADQEAACRRALLDLDGAPGGGVGVIVEPSARGTGPALGLATAWLARQDPEAVVCSTHADHHVGDADAYRTAICAAAGWARSLGGLATVGLSPTHAATGFGYIELGSQLAESAWSAPEWGPEVAAAPAAAAARLAAHRVERFVEKPPQELALRYSSDGRHLWNLGLFAWPARVLAEELAGADPELAAALDRVVAARLAGDEADAEAGYRALPVRAIEPLVLERSRRLTVVRASFSWSDLGSWPDIHEARRDAGEADPLGNVADGSAIALESRNCFVSGRGGRLLAVVGGEGLIAVDTGDAVLVMPAAQAQRVRELVARLDGMGRTDLL